MLVGHVAVGFLGKRVTPKVPLGALVCAGLFADLLWCVLMIAGIEELRLISRGTTLLNSIAVYNISYSHSLLSGAVLGGVLVHRRARR